MVLPTTLPPAGGSTTGPAASGGEKTGSRAPPPRAKLPPSFTTTSQPRREAPFQPREQGREEQGFAPAQQRGSSRSSSSRGGGLFEEHNRGSRPPPASSRPPRFKSLLEEEEYYEAREGMSKQAKAEELEQRRRQGGSGPPQREERRQGPAAFFFSPATWESAGVSEELRQALSAIGIVRPSHIQAATAKALLGAAPPGGLTPHYVVGDHSGSGKTLSYLVPLVQQLRAAEASQAEEEGKEAGSSSREGAPRIVVVTPTAELCAQAMAVARALAKGAPFRSFALTGGRAWRTQREALERGVDLVVATPGRLLEHVKAGSLSLEGCRAVVWDEADLLLGEESAFLEGEGIQGLREALPPTASNLMVTATLPEAFFSQLESSYPGVVPILGPGLHRTAPGGSEKLVDCSGGEEITDESAFERKAAALKAAIAEQAARRVIVFCNKIEGCRRVENFLSRSCPHLALLPHHAAITPAQRSLSLKSFLEQPSEEEGGPRVLICTDRAARGLDTWQVGHVVLFDFPRDPSEYVRRVGRTCRGAGPRGFVTVLAIGRQVPLAKEIMERNRRGQPIHKIPEYNSF